MESLPVAIVVAPAASAAADGGLSECRPVLPDGTLVAAVDVGQPRRAAVRAGRAVGAGRGLGRIRRLGRRVLALRAHVRDAACLPRLVLVARAHLAVLAPGIFARLSVDLALLARRTADAAVDGSLSECRAVLPNRTLVAAVDVGQPRRAAVRAGGAVGARRRL